MTAFDEDDELSTEQNSPPRWFIAKRWLEYEGEGKACILRLGMVIAFYGAQLAHFMFWSDGSEVAKAFHRQATLIAVIWLFLVLGVILCMKRGLFPSWLKFVITLGDLLLLTTLASLGDGPQSPLVLLFFVLLPLSLLRFSIPLCWFTTVGAIIGYMTLVAHADPTWFDSDHTTRPIDQLVTMLSILAVGTICDQILRSSRGFATAIEQDALRKDLGVDRIEESPTNE